MPNPTPHCSLNYHRSGGTDLENFSHGVSDGIYGNNPPFTAPPITQAVFDGLVTTYHAAFEAYFHGGSAQKGAYLTARTNLMDGLDTQAEYVDGMPGVDEDMITLSGFTPTKTGETKAVIPSAPVVDYIGRDNKGELTPSCKAVPGAEFYGCFVLENPWNDSMVLVNGQIIIIPSGPAPVFPTVRMSVTKSRQKTIIQLTSGKEYWIYFYAGNSAGISALSAGVSIICG